MKYKFNKKYIYQTLSYMIALCGAVLFYYLLFHGINLLNGVNGILKILSPIIYGFVLAYLLAPILNLIESKVLLKIFNRSEEPIGRKKSKIIRMVAVFFTMVIFLTFVYVFLKLVIPQILESLNMLISNIPSYINTMEDWARKVLKDNYEVEYIFDNYANEFKTWLSNDVAPRINSMLISLSNKVVNVFSFFWNTIIGVIISMYILSSKEIYKAQAKKILYAVTSQDYAKYILSKTKYIHKTFGGFIIGKIVDSLIIGMLCFIGCTLMQTPYAVLISVIVGVTNIIPFFGPYFGAIPSALLILLVDPRRCIYFIIFIIILQQVDGNIIGPKILGDSTGLSSFWVIFAITVFGGMFGVVGMFIGVPVFAVIYTSVRDIIYKQLKKKGMPTETYKYKCDPNLEYVFPGNLPDDEPVEDLEIDPMEEE